MRIVRYLNSDDKPQFGWAHQFKVGPIEGDPFGEYRRLEASLAIEELKLLAPVAPGKIICLGRNYAAHAAEHDAEVPEIPLIFLKPPSAVIGHNEKILLPQQSRRVEHEAELVVVIGRHGRRIKSDEAMKYVFGYTAGNDVTARDLQMSDAQWTRGKGFDTFCALGPWIETEFDPADAIVTCHVNGDLKQMASTRDMVFDIPRQISFISSVMTLEPGDIIMTGTPAGVSPLSPGDVVEVTIDGIGNLRNPVQSET